MKLKIKEFVLSHKVVCISAVIVIIAAVAVIAVAASTGGSAQVCIDPGHGGNDAGATNGSRCEKDDNLALALAVRDALKDRGIEVAMTRNSDEYISLEKRCQFANRRNVELFVSLHRNSAESSSASGIEAWIESDAGDKEQQLASDLLSGLKSAGAGQDRGVKTGITGNDSGNYYVNKHTEMTSCLLEVGFISSSGDNERFDENLKQYAEAIAEAIENNL